MTDHQPEIVGWGLHSETDEPWTLLRHEDELYATPGSASLGEAETWLASDLAERAPSPLRGVWRHYKGADYTVHAEARADDGIPLVVYTSSDGRVWLRPCIMWQEHVSTAAYTGARFVRASTG